MINEVTHTIIRSVEPDMIASTSLLCFAGAVSVLAVATSAFYYKYVSELSLLKKIKAIKIQPRAITFESQVEISSKVECPCCKTSFSRILKPVYIDFFVNNSSMKTVECDHCLTVSKWDVYGRPTCMEWREPTKEELEAKYHTKLSEFRSIQEQKKKPIRKSYLAYD